MLSVTFYPRRGKIYTIRAPLQLGWGAGLFIDLYTRGVSTDQLNNRFIYVNKNKTNEIIIFNSSYKKSIGKYTSQIVITSVLVHC